MVALVVLVTVGASIIAPIGSRRSARAVAEREVAALLLPGERVAAQVYASQRRPTDLWRLSHGVLVATDRRLLYLAVPPRTLLQPEDDGPPELHVESWSYEAAFTTSLARQSSESERFVLRTPTRTVTLRVDAEDRAATDAIQQLASSARQRAQLAAEQLQRSGVSPIRPERYITHIVRRGETLTGIAIEYSTSVAVLRQLNRLPDDGVRAGARLRVPEPRSALDPFAPLDADTLDDAASEVPPTNEPY